MKLQKNAFRQFCSLKLNRNRHSESKKIVKQTFENLHNADNQNGNSRL